MKDIAERLVELVKEDKELHDALVALIQAMTERERARAEWYSTRARVTQLPRP